MMVQRPLCTWSEFQRWLNDDDADVNALKAEMREMAGRPHVDAFCDKLLQLLIYFRVQEVNMLAGDASRRGRTYIDGIKEIEQQIKLLQSNKGKVSYAR